MKRSITAVVCLSVFIGIVPTPVIAASTMGGKCTKIGTFLQIGGKIAICKKTGTKSIWASATPAQKIVYQKQQQQILLTGRKQVVADLKESKEKYTNLVNLITPLNTILIEEKKLLIINSKKTLIDLQEQNSEAQQAKIINQNNLANINNSISSAQNTLNSLANQINIQQNNVNSAKFNNDASYNSYTSAKAQSDSLYYPSQRAMSDNSAMLAAKVLCDFGFGNCGIYSAAQYSYNLSIISQYNSASARTSSAYSSYSSYNSQYLSAFNALTSLKSQQSQSSNSIASLNNQKNQASQNISSADTKISNLEILIKQSLAKVALLESAEKRIEADLLEYSRLKGLVELNSPQYVVAVDKFLLIADEVFILSASIPNWNNKYVATTMLQGELESWLAKIKILVSSIESFLNTI
jgi:hypothetical protein